MSLLMMNVSVKKPILEIVVPDLDGFRRFPLFPPKEKADSLTRLLMLQNISRLQCPQK